MLTTTRRVALALPLAGLALAGRPAWAAKPKMERLSEIIAALEKERGGRLGVMAINHATGASIGHRVHERFALCSTFKLLLAALVLQRVEHGQEKLGRLIPVTKADIIHHSPVTEPLVGKSATVERLCEAIIEVSDNAGANLLLRAVGGPDRVTAFARSLGDQVTRLDRYEPALNEKLDERDTTSPLAMAELTRRLALGDALTPASRARLIGWMRAAETGLTRLRAGLPADWVAGDKTGTGMHGATNDVAVAWAPDGPAVVIAAYYEGVPDKAEDNAAVLATVGKIVAAMI